MVDEDRKDDAPDGATPDRLEEVWQGALESLRSVVPHQGPPPRREKSSSERFEDRVRKRAQQLAERRQQAIVRAQDELIRPAGPARQG